MQSRTASGEVLCFFTSYAAQCPHKFFCSQICFEMFYITVGPRAVLCSKLAMHIECACKYIEGVWWCGWFIFIDATNEYLYWKIVFKEHLDEGHCDQWQTTKISICWLCKKVSRSEIAFSPPIIQHFTFNKHVKHYYLLRHTWRIWK